MSKDDTTWREMLSKALTRKAQWDDKDDLLEILYWGRQIAALLLGIVCGIVPLKGFLALLLYVGVSTFAGNYYVTGFQEQDEESFGGFMELAKEGFGAAFATFMVAWISIYSGLHFE